MIYILHISTDIGGRETYYCKTMEIVKKTVFDCFPDWNIHTDTIDDIDDHLRERCEGSIIIETAKFIEE